MSQPEGAGLDTQRLAAARLWATNQFPYLAAAIFASPSLPAPGLGRLSIDRSWRVYADPAIVETASVEELGGELVHLAAHVLREHATRADAMGLGEQDELHHWVDAADAEIADDFPVELRRVSGGADPAALDVAEGRLAEEYYRHGSVRDGETVDCGSGAHGRPALWEPPLPPPDSESEAPKGVSQSDQDLIRRRVAADIDAAEAAEVAEGLRRWAEERMGPRVDWRAELAAVIRRAVSTVSGAVDYSYSRPSRRASISPDVVMPSLRRPEIEVAVVCDTSASVDDDLLGVAVAEVEGLLRAVGTRSLRVLACDDAVHATSRVVSLADLVLLGGGGTDLGVGLDAALEHRPPPQLVVVLTDGYTPWPDEGPRAHVVVGLLPADEPVASPDPPSWASVVTIDG
ncbi:MAG: vWA domain-containing protein [Acidimicrobiales bacterium]